MFSIWKVAGTSALAVSLLLSPAEGAQRRDPQAVQRVRTALDSLNLSEDQKAKIKPILAEQADKVRAARAEAKTDKRGAARKVRDILAETEGKIRPILSDEQWTKFQELQQKALAEQKAKRKGK